MGSELILGDNLEILKLIPSDSADLCYIDPPFFSNRNYKAILGDSGEGASFKDGWVGEIGSPHKLAYERVVGIHRALKSTGSFYLHCDWHADAYIFDKIFRSKNFRNDIVWRYRRWGR